MLLLNDNDTYAYKFIEKPRPHLIPEWNMVKYPIKFELL